MSFKVLAECVDSRTGKRFLAGEEFNPAPAPGQAARLVGAGCLPVSAIAAAEALAAEAERQAEEEVARRAAAQTASEAKPIDKMTKAELEALAAERGVDITGADTKADIIARLDAAAKV